MLSDEGWTGMLVPPLVLRPPVARCFGGFVGGALRCIVTSHLSEAAAAFIY